MLYIWIRRTLDWDDEALAAARIDEPMRPLTALWDATFNMSYVRFRQRLAAIAALSHDRVRGAVVRSWDEIPDGALVAPSDDDDWFAPHLAELLAPARTDDTLAYVWRSRWMQVPLSLGHHWHLFSRRIRPSLPPTWTCATNNYAMVKRADTEEPLRLHTKASAWVDARGADHPAIQRLSDQLSVANRSLASITSLRLGAGDVDRDGLITRYRSYRRLYRHRPSAAVGWATEYVSLMAELMAELEVV